jgi:tetratricopeptide (TPR) repeat protein
MISMRDQVTAKVRQGLLPVLGASAASAESGTRPANEEAYDLFLRSTAVPHDPAPNKEAITMLERSVGMDPNYAPAWATLGMRYYYDATYSQGGAALRERSNAAYERALALDPNLMMAAGQLITSHTDAGELVKAYSDARALVDKRPDSGHAHFSLSYVLRYASVLQEAAHECDTALALDPGNYQYRSCALVFLQLGRFDRARDFIRLDAGSEWSTYATIYVLTREGKMAEVRDTLHQISRNPYYNPDLIESCLTSPPPTDLEQIARKAGEELMTRIDPEPSYFQGTFLAFCGQKEVALRLLNRAISQNYCSYEALRSDPLLAKFRSLPEFSQLLAAAKQCQQSFLNATRPQ